MNKIYRRPEFIESILPHLRFEMSRFFREVVGVLALGACIHGTSLNAEEVKMSQTYPLREHGIITLENITGDVQIAVWEKPEVELVAVKHAKTAAECDAVEIAVKAKPDSISIVTKSHERIRGDHQEYHTPTVNYVLHVPANARLKTVRTVNGNIRINGPHTVEMLKTVNGSIRVAYPSQGAGGFSSGSFSTTNGSIEVAMPRETNVSLKANILNGGIRSDFPGIQIATALGHTSAHGKVGAGGPLLKLNSSNGRIAITAL